MQEPLKGEILKLELKAEAQSGAEQRSARLRATGANSPTMSTMRDRCEIEHLLYFPAKQFALRNLSVDVAM